VRLRDGHSCRRTWSWWPAGCGPETDLAERPLRVERGIVVNDRLRTSRRLYLGDRRTARSTPVWSPGWWRRVGTAGVVAGVITGRRPLDRTVHGRCHPAQGHRHRPGAMGDSTSESGEQVTFADPARVRTRSLVCPGHRLAGAILLVTIRQSARDSNFSTGRASAIRSAVPVAGRASAAGRNPPPRRSPALMPEAAVVCPLQRGQQEIVGQVLAAMAGARWPTWPLAPGRAPACGGCRDTVEGSSTGFVRRRSAGMTRVVVIGHSMVGHRFVEACGPAIRTGQRLLVLSERPDPRRSGPAVGLVRRATA